MSSTEWTEPKGQKVQKMFNDIAPGYDKANTVLSAGVHHLWRKKLVKLSGAKKGSSVLDCATGTGDLAIEFAKVVTKEGLVVGTDFCQGMIDLAPEKAQSIGLENIAFKTADVTNLPFEEGQFDIATISFGIRNVEDMEKGLSELHRVVKPGGQVLILEFGQPQIPVFKQAYNLYSQKVLPLIGGWITGQKEAYRYLQETSSRFPCGEEFIQCMKNSGSYDKVLSHSLTGGIAYIYQGFKSL